MAILAGTRLGPYEIVKPLGSGGMGEVFAGSDTRLGRLVAVKILRQELTGDADRARFEREARAVASLTHPHICTLHDVGSDNGRDFLVMELLEGETLADRLTRGPLPVETTLEYASQIASALDCAHRQGIVHRDLKPANVMLTKSGVKLLDFGLARFRPEPVLDGALLTRSVDLTEKGTILGTPQYMAPEQLEGEPADARTDLFAFGAIVYEMTTGRRAFAASSRVGLIAAILESDPPALVTIRPDVPPVLDRVVKICLAKNPDDRWSTAHDVLLLLKGIAADEQRVGLLAATARPARLGRAVWLLVPILIAAGVFVSWGGWSQSGAPLDFVSVLPPAGTALDTTVAPQVSPNGEHVVFPATDMAGRTSLFVRTRGTPGARLLPGTDDATLPFWSPDSSQIGFFAQSSLKTTTLSGSRPRTLASASVPRGGTWGRDGVIVFVPFPNDFPRQVPATGGAVATVPVHDSNERRWFPSFLPDGRHYLYLSIDITRRKGTEIRVASLDSTDTKELMPSVTSALYAEPGYVVFRRENALMAQPFDARRLALEGNPSVVVENVGSGALSYQTFFSASADGTLAFLESPPAWHLVWFDRFGRRQDASGPEGHYNSLSMSPDGKQIVYDAADLEAGNVDIWSLDLAGGAPSRLTFDPAVDFYPTYGPGGEVVFASLRAGPPTLFRQKLFAPGSETMVLETPAPVQTNDWSRDGRLLVYSSYDQETNWDVWVLPLVADGKPFPVIATDAEERNARLSPDGRWIAYGVRENDRMEVYVQPFPATGAKWQISPSGGSYPVWRADGRELFYFSPDQKLVAVEVTAGGSSLVLGRRQVILQTRLAGWERANQGSPYAVTPDGQRFLVISASDGVTPITLIQNWTSALRN